MTAEEELVADRTKMVLAQWPHLRCMVQHEHVDECKGGAYGCLNCNLIFAHPVRTAMMSDTDGRCPNCKSESVFDVAAALDVAAAATLVAQRAPLSSVVAEVEGMIERLDAELENGGPDVRVL